MSLTLRDYNPSDADTINRLPVTAFSQLSTNYNDWPAMTRVLEKMSLMAASAELIIAEHDGRIVGAVGYMPPHAAKAAHFKPEWPIVRMLVVNPAARGSGAGRALTEECVARARRDRAPDRIAYQRDDDRGAATLSANGICARRGCAGFVRRALRNLREAVGRGKAMTNVCASSAFGNIRAIDYTVILVRDMAAMRHFYENVLGFSMHRELAPNWIEYRFGKNTLTLARPSLISGDALTPQGSASLQLAFKVAPTDVDRCADELVQKGVALLSPPTDQSFGHRTVFFRDPDGNLLEVFADIPSRTAP